MGGAHTASAGALRPGVLRFVSSGTNAGSLSDFLVCRSYLPARKKSPDLPSSPTLRYPQVLCLLSQHPWFAFYFKVRQLSLAATPAQNDLQNDFHMFAW